MRPKFVVVTFSLANDKLSRWQRQRQLYANKHYTGQHSTQLTAGRTDREAAVNQKINYGMRIYIYIFLLFLFITTLWSGSMQFNCACRSSKIIFQAGFQQILAIRPVRDSKFGVRTAGPSFNSKLDIEVIFND